ncbi:MAG: hypothetical protein Q4B78_03690, partial [Bacillota bacterium]|nr:hypothetical protein [Bacillota bacterium]
SGEGSHLSKEEIEAAINGEKISVVRDAIDKLDTELGKYIGKRDYVINSVVFDMPDGSIIAEGAAIDYVESVIYDYVKDIYLHELLSVKEGKR